MDTKPLVGTVMVTLEVLSSKVSLQELRQYEQELQEYQKDLDRSESLGIPVETDAPEQPDSNITYRSQRLNFSCIDILSYDTDWDNTHDCEIIILDFKYKNTDIVMQYNIKCTLKEWETILKDLGTIIYGTA